jgi:hypothetical protein
MNKRTEKHEVAPGMTMIELQARNYANAREKLATTIACLNDQLDDVKKKYLARICAQAAEAKTVQAGLRARSRRRPSSS